MTRNFPGTLYRLYATNLNFLLRQVWRLIYKFIDEFTQSKLKVLGNHVSGELNELIPVDSREQFFGGTLPNVKDNFFPPNYSV
mmetsp:Transcript_35130/g.46254  ORF Transcript_35130/g.46254 Transcript_35130/m.46254 type:complete len:83 (-) Transcript_35130:55-303(-)